MEVLSFARVFFFKFEGYHFCCNGNTRLIAHLLPTLFFVVAGRRPARHTRSPLPSYVACTRWERAAAAAAYGSGAHAPSGSGSGVGRVRPPTRSQPRDRAPAAAPRCCRTRREGPRQGHRAAAGPPRPGAQKGVACTGRLGGPYGQNHGAAEGKIFRDPLENVCVFFPVPPLVAMFKTRK